MQHGKQVYNKKKTDALESSYNHLASTMASISQKVFNYLMLKLS